MFGKVIYFDEVKINEYKSALLGKNSVKINHIEVSDDKGIGVNIPIANGSIKANKSYTAEVSLDCRKDIMDENVLREVIVMALIKCPECGRENVSDSAEACPNCGYGIRAHFEKVRQEEDKKRREEEKRKKEEEQNKNRNDTTADNANMTELSSKLMLGILGAFLALVIVIIAVQTSNEKKNKI